MTPPDVVFPVRRGDHNPELRYALRTLSLVPHGRVWLSGYRPRWVAGVGYIPTRQAGTKHENALRNILAACRHPEVSEEFILWNDDIFLTQPIKQIPILHRGTMVEFLEECRPLGNSSYAKGVRTTAQILMALGHLEALSYELHVPLPMRKTQVLEVYAMATAEGMPPTPALQIRSLYGNHAGIGGVRSDDVKVFSSRDEWTPGPFLSTMDQTWGRHRASLAIARRHPRPSPYEVEGAHR